MWFFCIFLSLNLNIIAISLSVDSTYYVIDITVTWRWGNLVWSVEWSPRVHANYRFVPHLSFMHTNWLDSICSNATDRGNKHIGKCIYTKYFLN